VARGRDVERGVSPAAMDARLSPQRFDTRPESAAPGGAEYRGLTTAFVFEREPQLADVSGAGARCSCSKP
jgi:hypothetical protein